MSDCSGGMTGEHLVSQCLFTEKVSVRGLSWCLEEIQTIGLASLVSNCLCERHNTSLSACDQEAKKWKNAIEWADANRFLPGDGPAKVLTLDGHLFAKWLAKTACNMAAAERNHVPLPIAQYSFDDKDNPAIHVYFPLGLGSQFELNNYHIGARWIHSVDDPDNVLVSFLFYGMTVMIGEEKVSGTIVLFFGCHWWLAHQCVRGRKTSDLRKNFTPSKPTAPVRTNPSPITHPPRHSHPRPEGASDSSQG